MELQDVMGHTDQSPFAAYLGDPAQQELPEALPRLDLSEHRLDDRLPPGIPAPTPRPIETPCTALLIA